MRTMTAMRTMRLMTCWAAKARVAPHVAPATHGLQRVAHPHSLTYSLIRSIPTPHPSPNATDPRAHPPQLARKTTMACLAKRTMRVLMTVTPARLTPPQPTPTSRIIPECAEHASLTD